MNEVRPSEFDVQLDAVRAAMDVVDLIPIPMGGDRMVRLRTLEEALDDFDRSRDPEAVSYLIQVRPRQGGVTLSPASAASPSAAGVGALAAGPAMLPGTPAARGALDEFTPTPLPPTENIYQPDGKLNVAFLLRNAELLMVSGDYALARNIYRTLIQGGEKTSVALFGISRCFAAEGKSDEACLHLEESITYHPTLEAYRMLAQLLIQLKRDHQAAEVLERALNLKDLSPAARYDLHKAAGNCWTRVRRFPDAERHFQKALELQPGSAEMRGNLGAVYLQSGKLAPAKREFQTALAANPKVASAYSGLAACFLAEGDKRQAHDHFARALDLELNNPQAMFQLVKCAYEIKSYATAARLLEEYVDIAPVNANLMYSLAGLQFHLGRTGDARKTVSRILEIAPQHAAARELASLIERPAAVTP